jgi:hypothetical protein
MAKELKDSEKPKRVKIPRGSEPSLEPQDEEAKQRWEGRKDLEGMCYFEKKQSDGTVHCFYAPDVIYIVSKEMWTEVQKRILEFL